MSKRRKMNEDSDDDSLNISIEEVTLSPVPSVSSSSIEHDGGPAETSWEEELKDECVDSNLTWDKSHASHEGIFITGVAQSCEDHNAQSFSGKLDHEQDTSCLDVSSESIKHDVRDASLHQKNILQTSLTETTIALSEESDSDVSLGICEDEVSDFDLSEDDENITTSSDHALYDGAPITINDSMIAILSYIIRHELDGKEIVDLLELINLRCKPEQNKMKTSLYFLKKYFSYMDCSVIYHYYCSGCYFKLIKKESQCPNADAHPSTTGACIFVPLVPQLQSLFRQEKFYSNLSYKNTRKKLYDGNLEDIYDGQVYKELEKAGILSKDNILSLSFIMNADGVPVFKSTHKSLWPVFFNVNELPPHLRFAKEFTLIGGLWYGGKPSANLILEPLMKPIKCIQKGFSVTLPSGEVKTANGILIAAAADIPAKVMLCGMASYSGHFGCQICKIEGESVKFVKKNTISKNKKRGNEEKMSTAWVYKFTDDLPLRNHSGTVKFGKEAQKILQDTNDLKTNVFGVKYPSAIFKMMYDGIRGFAVDDLHTLYLGVSKTLLKLWFDSSHSSEPFSLGKFLPSVDYRIMALKLPNILERGVRKIEADLAYFKGTELQTWILYLSIPLLDGIMPDKFLEHHVDLVSCLHILQSSSISPEALLSCDKKLKNYVKQFEILYGTRYMTMDIHLLQHLVFAVNNLGPMRFTSCFPYEGLNGEILKIIHGTRYIETQLASGCFLIKQLPMRLDTLLSSKVKEYCDKMLHPSLRLKKLEDIHPYMFSVGTYQSLSPQQNYVYNALNKQGIQQKCTKIESFLRLKKDKLLFVSRSYCRMIKRNSFTCTFLSDRTTLQHGAIDIFVKVSSSDLVKFYAIVELAAVEPYAVGSKEVSHIFRLFLSKEYVAIPLSQLRRMLVCVDVEDNSFVCEPI